MSKTLELAIESLANKIEALEREVTELKGSKNNSGYNREASKTDEASHKQIKFLQDLGIEPPEKITKYEAKILIQETLNKKNQQKPIVKSESNEKPLKEKNDNPSSNSEPKEEEEKGEEFDENGAYL